MSQSKSYALLRIRAVMAMRGNKSHTSVYNDLREGLLTPPIRTGHRIVAWPEFEVAAINRYRIADKTDADIKALVKELVARRPALADLRDLVYVVLDGDPLAQASNALDAEGSA